MPTARPKGLLARLHAKLDRSGGPDACWPFKGALSRGRKREAYYGSLRPGGRADGPPLRVNRLVLLLEDLPEEAFLTERALLRWLHLANLHRREVEAAHGCDNSRCGNPRHLEWQPHGVNVSEQARRRAAGRAEVAA